jgi:hypothetical protein
MRHSLAYFAWDAHEGLGLGQHSQKKKDTTAGHEMRKSGRNGATLAGLLTVLAPESVDA